MSQALFARRTTFKTTSSIIIPTKVHSELFGLVGLINLKEQISSKNFHFNFSNFTEIKTLVKG